MKVLITGAGGIVGRYIAASLLEAGYQVFGLSRNRAKAQLASLPETAGMQWLEGDILDITDLDEAVKGMDVVIHAAGLVSFFPSDRSKLMLMNQQGTANMVNACLKEKCRLLHISSVACITPARPMPCEVDERQGFLVDKDTSDYAVSKHLAELEVFRGREEGLRVALVNPVIVLAPGAEDESSASLVRYAMKPRLFQPAGWLNYIDARDLAALVKSIIESNAFSGERMIASGGFIPFPDFFSKVAGLQKIRKPLITTGPVLAGIGWRMAALFTVLTGKKQLLTRFTAAAAVRRFRYISQHKDSFMQGFAFRSLDETLAWILSKNG